MPTQPEKVDQILELLASGVDDNREIAARVGVSPGSVAAVKAHVTMGTYERETETIAEQIESAADLKFGLERDLQRALRNNIQQLEKGLRIIDGGQEKCTDGFRFDITAEDSNGTAVIIELKAGEAKKDAVSQLLSYIGAQMESGDTRLVRGMIVAESFDRQAKLAAKAVPNKAYAVASGLISML
jgi:hypothetical protein